MKSGKPSLSSLVAFGIIVVTLVLVYVLSYAPFIRYRYGDPPIFRTSDLRSFDPEHEYFRRNSHPVYIPVEWLIDDSPFRQPLLWWSDVWSARRKTEIDSYLRSLPAREDVTNYTGSGGRAKVPNPRLWCSTPLGIGLNRFQNLLKPDASARSRYGQTSLTDVSGYDSV